MKLSEYIPQEINLLEKRQSIEVAKRVGERLRELLISEGDIELDDEFVALSLGQMKSLLDYNEATQKVYWAIWDATKEVFSGK